LAVTAATLLIFVLWRSTEFGESGNYADGRFHHGPQSCIRDKPVCGPWDGFWFERPDTVAQWLMMTFILAATILLLPIGGLQKGW
jgi:hypothetical protein